MKTKKELKNEYRSLKFRVGVFQILNKKEDRIFLQISTDLDRAFNSDLFQLKAGMHSNKMLQKDWDQSGPESFEFSVFDKLRVKETANPLEINKDLKELLEMHVAELKKNGQLLY